MLFRSNKSKVFAFVTHTVKTEMLLWPKVCCFSWMLYTRCYCELVTNDFQDILVPLGAMNSALGNKKFLKSISIHFNCSFMQLKQQTSGHNNISLLVVKGTTIFVWIKHMIQFDVHGVAFYMRYACCTQVIGQKYSRFKISGNALASSPT